MVPHVAVGLPSFHGYQFVHAVLAVAEHLQDSQEGMAVDSCNLQNSSYLEVVRHSRQRGNVEVVPWEVIGWRLMCCCVDCSQNRVDK